MPDHPHLTLTDLIRHVQNQSGLVDPHEITHQVIADLHEHMTTEDALHEALPHLVRQVMRTGRLDVMRGPHATRPSGSSGGKVAAVRTWHEQFLAQPVDVSGNGGHWKALRDCTRDDLLAVAQHRRKVAAANIATAALYEALASHLTGPTATVACLPEALVASVCTEAAA